MKDTAATVKQPPNTPSEGKVKNRPFSVSLQKRSLATKVLLLVCLRGGLLALQLGFQLAIARTFGSAALGSLQLFTSYTATLGECSLLGVPANNMRQVSQANRDSNRNHIWRYLVKGTLAVVLTSTLLSVCLISLSHTPLFDSFTPMKPFLWALAFALISYCLIRCFGECLKAIERPKLAMLIETGLVPLIMLIAITTLIMLEKQDTQILIYSYTAVCMAAAVVMIIAVIRQFKTHFQSNLKPFLGDIWFQWKPLWIGGLLGIVYGQFGMLVLPFFTDMNTVGIASAAFRYITLTTTLLMVLASLFAPKFAAHSSNATQLKKLLKQTQIISLVLFLPFGVVFVAFPQTILVLFGDEFIGASSMLQILCLGQCVNAATGIPGVLLKMTGHAKLEQNSLAICLTIAFISLPFVGLTFGAVGVMSLFAVLVAMKNGVSYALALHTLKKMADNTSLATNNTEVENL